MEPRRAPPAGWRVGDPGSEGPGESSRGKDPPPGGVCGSAVLSISGRAKPEQRKRDQQRHQQAATSDDPSPEFFPVGSVLPVSLPQPGPPCSEGVCVWEAHAGPVRDDCGRAVRAASPPTWIYPARTLPRHRRHPLTTTPPVPVPPRRHRSPPPPAGGGRRRAALSAPGSLPTRASRRHLRPRAVRTVKVSRYARALFLAPAAWFPFCHLA